VPVLYRGSVVGRPLKLDVVVGGVIVVEVKAVQSFVPVHHAQVISYLKLTQCPVGLLINFNVTLLKHGIRKVVRPDLYKKKSPVSPVPLFDPVVSAQIAIPGAPCGGIVRQVRAGDVAERLEHPTARLVIERTITGKIE